MDGQEHELCIRILFRNRLGDTLRFSGISHYVNQVPALTKEEISTVFAVNMFYRICLDICQRCSMDADDRRRHHGSAVFDVHRDIGMLYSVWTDPDQYRLQIAV